MVRQENPNNYATSLNKELEDKLLRRFYQEKKQKIIEGIIKYKLEKREEALREQQTK